MITSQNLQPLKKPIQLNFCHVTRNFLIVSWTDLYSNFKLFLPLLGLTKIISLPFYFFQFNWDPFLSLTWNSLWILDTFQNGPIWFLYHFKSCPKSKNGLNQKLSKIENGQRWDNKIIRTYKSRCHTNDRFVIYANMYLKVRSQTFF